MTAIDSVIKTESSYEPSCIFFGNIQYETPEQELKDTFKLAGPFSVFRLKIDSKTEKPKGYGFCMYSDPDVASSALRNLKQHEVQGRKLKAAFASDNKIGNNLSTKDVLYRDPAEVIKTQAVSSTAGQQ